MKPTFPKWGLGSFPGLSKLQSLITRVKTPRIRVFLISLKRYRSVDVENGFTWAIWTFATHIMAKRRAMNQPDPNVCRWSATHRWKALEESYKFASDLIPNWRSEQRVMISQSPGSPNQDNFGTPPWESWDKQPFRCRCHGET
jgi:hypothetical protein